MTPERPEAIRLILRIVDLLVSLDIRYHLGGSYASSVHGIPRQTQDIDLVVDLRAEQIDDLIASVTPEFYADAGAALAAIRDRSEFNLVHLETGIKVDLFVLGTGAFDQSEFGRRRLHVIDPDTGRTIFVKSAEDTILRKLSWYREGGEVSDRQWTDVAGIVEAQRGSLDRAYLDSWADALGVRDLLDRLDPGPVV